jgi:thiamine pyrophosphate-dependent acetolactate synthase large subunit-like protein
VTVRAETNTGLSLDGGTALVRALLAGGVRDVFGVPAGKLGAFLRAVAREPRLRHVGTRHESSAAWMAAATFHGAGQVAVCYGEMGPGAHNLVAGLGSARANGLAALVITSGPPTHLGAAATAMTMAANVGGLMRATTKSSTVVPSPEQIPALVQAALREALSGRPGPVHLEIPADVVAGALEGAPSDLDVPVERQEPPVPRRDDLERAAELLLSAERPLLVAGGGVVLAEATVAFRKLAERLGAAATATQMGLGAVRTDGPSFFGHGGLVGGEGVMRALREADVVLLAGCRLASWLWEGSAPALPGPPSQAVIAIDVEPDAISRVLPLTLALEGDARATLERLVDAAGEGRPAADAAWLASLVSAYRHHRELLFADADVSADLHPGVLAREVGDWLPDGALAVFDGGHTTFWSNDLTPATEPRTRFHEPGLAHLGFGLPYALGLQLAFPERIVVNVTGDGAFGFTLSELDTARRYRLPIVNVVHDNASWGVIRFGQARAGFELDTSLEGTDYAAIARAFGCHGEVVTAAEDIRPALDRAVASRLPAVVDVRVRFVPHPSLPRFAAVGQVQR